MYFIRSLLSAESLQYLQLGVVFVANKLPPAMADAVTRVPFLGGTAHMLLRMRLHSRTDSTRKSAEQAEERRAESAKIRQIRVLPRRIGLATRRMENGGAHDAKYLRAID
jgi:hypothetical protein